jgi:hypothetical protein
VPRCSYDQTSFLLFMDICGCVQVQACIEVTAVPQLPGVAELVEACVHSTAETANRDVLCKVDDQARIMLTAQSHALLDPQTSGAPQPLCRKALCWKKRREHRWNIAASLVVVDHAMKWMLAGGLLAGVEQHQVGAVVQGLHEAGYAHASVIGQCHQLQLDAHPIVVR